MTDLWGMDATNTISNELPQLIPITAQNAREMQARGVIARKINRTERELRELEAEKTQKQMEYERANNATLQEQLRARVISQLDDLSVQWKKDKRARYSIAQAQATLWKLLFPQPKAGRSRSSFTPAEPLDPGQNPG